MKLVGNTNSEIVDLLKSDVDSLKSQIKHQLEKIIKLEILLATLRERYVDKALGSRGKKKIT